MLSHLQITICKVYQFKWEKSVGDYFQFIVIQKLNVTTS